MKVTCCWFVCLLLVAAFNLASSAEKNKGAAGSGEEQKVEAVIEDVNAKQFERLLEEKDYVAVYWCKYSETLSLCPKRFYSVLLTNSAKRMRVLISDLVSFASIGSGGQAGLTVV